MNFQEAYSLLSPEQKAAVDHLEGPVMVLAGPGTGKTQIIALRIARILQHTQMEPRNILCLTFTDSGVVAMRSRLLEMIGSLAYQVRIHTFHSFCNEVIQENPETFLFARELTPLTDVERVQLLRKILDALSPDAPLHPFANPYFYTRDVSKALQDLKRENVSPELFEKAITQIEDTLKTHQNELETFVTIHGNQLKESDVRAIQEALQGTIFTALFSDYDLSDKKERTAFKNALKDFYEELESELPKQKSLLTLYRAYQAELQKTGRYDFEDMVLFVLDQFQANPRLLARYQEQFQYILVDEYQDTNGAQNEVVRLLASYFEVPNVFTVGDDKQSVFRFQGASLENMLSFYHLNKKSIQLIALRSNYRSQQTVLDAAHSLIAHSPHTLAKQFPELSDELFTATTHPQEPLRLAEFENPSTERYFLAKQIQNLIRSNAKPSEIAVIYRNHRDAEELTELFLRMNIPFRVLAGHDVLKDKQIQKLLSLLRALTDLSNGNQLFHVLNYDFLNFSPVEVARFTHRASQHKKSFYECMLESDIFAPFAEKLAHWGSLAVNLPFASFFDRLIKESGYLDHILSQENKIEHLNRLTTLFNELKKLNNANPELKLKDFIDYLDLLKENDITLPEQELATQNDAVRLLTAHKSKGLEFEHVFIMNCTDKHWGNVPSRNKIKLPPSLLRLPTHSEKNEEERRLFYVALTRAKKTITLSYAKQNENRRAQMPSQFLSEIDAKFLQKVETSELENDALNHLSTLFFDVPKTAKLEEEAFVRGLLENYTLSVTHLNNYLRCPRLFYYNNILRVPRAKTEPEAFGTAIHRSLQDWLTKNPSKEELLAQFEHHLKREILSTQEFRGGLELGQKTLSAYFDHYHGSQNRNVLTEFDFSSHGVTVDGVPITGKLDKIEIINEADKTVHTVDYKTGNPDSKAAELREGGEYRRQIAFYQLLCNESKAFPYRMVSGEIDFVQPSKKSGDFIKKTFIISPQELTELRTLIHSVYEDIQNLRFLHPDEFESCGECEYCEFHS